jgi:uncharacterized protein
MGPCELHKRHAHTIGPDGALYACPGFAGEAHQAVGDIAEDTEGNQPREAARRFARLSPWREACGDCAFVPVCGGGCSVAAQQEAGDLHAASCHKASFVAGAATIAQESLSRFLTPAE